MVDSLWHTLICMQPYVLLSLTARSVSPTEGSSHNEVNNMNKKMSRHIHTQHMHAAVHVVVHAAYKIREDRYVLYLGDF